MNASSPSSFGRSPAAALLACTLAVACSSSSSTSSVPADSPDAAAKPSADGGVENEDVADDAGAVPSSAEAGEAIARARCEKLVECNETDDTADKCTADFKLRDQLRVDLARNKGKACTQADLDECVALTRALTCPEPMVSLPEPSCNCTPD